MKKVENAEKNEEEWFWESDVDNQVILPLSSLFNEDNALERWVWNDGALSRNLNQIISSRSNKPLILNDERNP